MKSNPHKLRGSIYTFLGVVFGLVSLIGIALLTLFFFMDSMTWENFFQYLIFLVLYVAIGVIALILYGSGKVYLNGPSPEREEFERIRKETNRTRNQL